MFLIDKKNKILNCITDENLSNTLKEEIRFLKRKCWNIHFFCLLKHTNNGDIMANLKINEKDVICDILDIKSGYILYDIYLKTGKNKAFTRDIIKVIGYSWHNPLIVIF